MSDSNKSRFGTRCKFWKDTVLSSRSQKRAWSKRKKINSQKDRQAGKNNLRKEVESGQA